ncbi:MAG: 3-hydroxyacyl-[acyl-carrier-protein] dehydratase FabZ [Chlamydiales bacterium]|nr:3-hydroxyacyl-[acyl-carrier-protein] dehydratase FabZ [Chlamydiales bacterium]MCH9619765.1 3-hydroxyacyl-[acyl-carrier-protein] dehydratase FabZ [Chlamydiales bacterium]MCH9623371.1 3-hydroxyacyl-[acyl-carrier-protein] dehydratase FabZ [Chlamydiales bacterium]
MIFDSQQVRRILPHRYPFLLVDCILEMDLEKHTILGQKNVTINEPFFQGHFPQAPIMPGVLILEAMAQVGGVLLHESGYEDKIALFLSVKNAKFRKPVLPGDVLHLFAEGKIFSSKGGRIYAKATVGSKVACEAEIGYGLVNKDQFFQG